MWWVRVDGSLRSSDRTTGKREAVRCGVVAVSRWHPHQTSIEDTGSHGPRVDRREYRLATQFYGALCAHERSDTNPEDFPSLATLETSSHDNPEVRLSPALESLRDDCKSAVESVDRKLELFQEIETATLIEEPEDEYERLQQKREFRREAMELIESGQVDERGSEAIQEVMGRSHDRRMKVLELVRQNESSHAYRLATCMRQSVQLRCPSLAGGCGTEDNYVPMSCKSRLCPDCQKRRLGKEIGKYTQVVQEWRQPTMVRLSLDGRRADPGAGRQELLEALGKFRRRKVPAEGEHQGVRWVWKSDGERPAKHYWKQSLCAAGFHQEAREWERKYVDEGRWIPVDEIMPSRIRGIDFKQAGDGTWNVHAHLIADMRYFPQAALASVWEDCGGGPNVDVRQVKTAPGYSMESAVMETIAYSCKAPEAESIEEAVALVIEEKGAKLVQPSGELYGNVPDDGAMLRCSECEQTPAYWEYLGVVDEVRDNMGSVHGSDSDGPPPE